jgi:hypothetical protein
VTEEDVAALIQKAEDIRGAGVEDFNEIVLAAKKKLSISKDISYKILQLAKSVCNHSKEIRVPTYMMATGEQRQMEEYVVIYCATCGTLLRHE